jgi:hypothetical protein
VQLLLLCSSCGYTLKERFKDFVSGAVAINWLDPSDKGTPQEQAGVLRLLWNFSIEQERKEEELYGDY